jgi:hypothetical protein
VKNRPPLASRPFGRLEVELLKVGLLKVGLLKVVLLKVVFAIVFTKIKRLKDKADGVTYTK